MSFALKRKQIRCPNCRYEGKAKIEGTGGWLFLGAIISFLVGIVFWPMLLIAVVLVLVAIFRPAKQICPKCGWKHPIPI